MMLEPKGIHVEIPGSETLMLKQLVLDFSGTLSCDGVLMSGVAERLKAQGEVIIEEYGCYWWGRQSSGQAIYMDGVIQEICGND